MESWGYADLGIHEVEKAVKKWLKVGFSKIEGREMFNCYIYIYSVITYVEVMLMY